MALYRIALLLLLCSHPLCATLYWSQMPGVGAVKLTTLSSEQHSMLAEHLNISAAETTEWLQALPELLDALSCSGLDSQRQSLPAYVDASYQLVSYAGVLKFSSDDNSKQRVWWLPWSLLPSLAELHIELATPDKPFHQPLLVTELELQQKGQFVVVSGTSNSSPGYFALRLNSLQQPELLWSISSATADFEQLTGSMAQPVLITQQTAVERSALSVLLPNTAVAEQKAVLYKVDLLTGAEQATLTPPQAIINLSGALTLYDRNIDSLVDTLVFSTKAGHIWQVQLENNQFYNLELVADLSALQLSDMQFIQMLYAAVPVGGSGSDFHSRRSQWLVLLTAIRQQNTLFGVLKLRDILPLQMTDLVDRTQPIAAGAAVLTEPDWLLIQQKWGWYQQLTGRLLHKPMIAAGVIYLSASGSEVLQQCASESESEPVTVMALHLHHGSFIEQPKVMQFEKLPGPLKVQLNQHGGFALIEHYQQRVVIEQMREISPDCANCSKVMYKAGFPRWQLMGTYHSEEGAYE